MNSGDPQGADGDQDQQKCAKRPGTFTRMAIASRGDQRQQHKGQESQQRGEQDDVILKAMWKQCKNSEIPHEVPVRSRIGVEQAGIRRRLKMRRAKVTDSASTTATTSKPKTASRQTAVGQNGSPC